MRVIYFPSCKFTAQFPEASKKIKEYVQCKHHAQIAGYCKQNLNKITSDDIVICICHTCAAFFQESSSAGKVISIWEVLLGDDDFVYPDYAGKQLTVQDCWYAYDNKAQQDAVRKILEHMNLDVLEMADHHDKTRFCGCSLYTPLAEKYDKLAPRRLVADAQGLFISHSKEEQARLMEAHCNNISTDEVACYCFSCLNGINLGGKKGVHIAELVFDMYDG